MLDLLLRLLAAAAPFRRDEIRAGLALRQAQRAWRAGDHARAEELFERALSFGLTDSRPYVQYGAALLEQGDVARAVELLQNATEVQPANPVPLIFLGLALSDAGQQVEACSALQEAGKLAAHNLLARSTTALVRMRSGQVPQAAAELLKDGVADNLRLRTRLLVETERFLRTKNATCLLADLIPPRAAEPEPKPPHPSWNGRRCFKEALRAFHRGEFKAARVLLDAAAARQFASDDLLLYSAGTTLALGGSADAAEAFCTMPENSTLRGAALFYAAISRYCNNEPAAARSLLDQVVAAGNVHDFEEYVHYYRGLCFAAEGDDLAARKEFADALDIDPAILTQRLALAVA